MHGYIFYPSFSYIPPNFDIWIKFLFLLQLFPCPIKIWFKNRVCEYWSIHLPKTIPPLCFINADINLNSRMIWKWGRGMHHIISLSINRFWYNPIINSRRFPMPFPCIWKLIWVTPSQKHLQAQMYPLYFSHLPDQHLDYYCNSYDPAHCSWHN